ncbi:class I SAM-dependent methyltransferase [Acrocarpospora catenulata]|uniref:class I SAM-dependent methyltransferase n=1 Tax=Acrocarpospora catenulata TaxID=2836182 RepID=UPI001BD96FCA|nr:class I SAM-dependent methyltransferase [Acrocarpospora catenulata]
MDRLRLRVTFDEDAGLYDRARPGYPAALFADLAELAGAGPGCRVLEIGCGTGKATVPLAERGCRVTAVELGPALAGVARRRLAAFPEAEVVTADFEHWPLPAEPYDLVVAATSFHWLDPAMRVAKSAAALRPGGKLAIVRTHHVRGGTSEFFAQAQECYLRFDPDTPPDLRLEEADEIPRDSAEVDGSGFFAPALFRRYEWELTYTAATYRDLLMTYSNHRALDSEAREGLLACIRHLIDSAYDGRITKRFLTELQLSEKLTER